MQQLYGLLSSHSFTLMDHNEGRTWYFLILVESLSNYVQANEESQEQLRPSSAVLVPRSQLSNSDNQIPRGWSIPPSNVNPARAA